MQSISRYLNKQLDTQTSGLDSQIVSLDTLRWCLDKDMDYVISTEPNSQIESLETQTKRLRTKQPV